MKGTGHDYQLNQNVPQKKVPRLYKKGNSSRGVKRGEVYWADLSPVVGSEQGGIRPFLILSNDKGNSVSPVVNGVPLTKQVEKALEAHLPTQAIIETPRGTQVALLEHNRSLDKERLGGKIMDICSDEMSKVESALKLVFDLGNTFV